MVRLGIDLGTSNSAAALLREGALKAVIVEPEEGPSDRANVFPSYVAFDSQGNVTKVGLHAKEGYRDGGLVIRHFKRLIGRNYDFVAKAIAGGNRSFLEFKGMIERGPAGEVLLKVGPKRYTATEIAAALLAKIREEAEDLARSRWSKGIDEVTISVPASWEDEQRKATEAAAKLAGFPSIKVIEEPTAAAIAWGLEGQEGNIAVVDIGAGTSDIVVGSMIQIEGTPRLVMSARKCDDLLGGMDMDRCIFEYLLEKDQNEPRLSDIYPRLEMVERNRLMFNIEAAKISASLDGHGTISMSLRLGDNEKPKRISVPLDEQTLNKIVEPIIRGEKTADQRLKGIRPLLEGTILEVAKNDAAKLEEVKQQVNNLIIVGGPCRMRVIHEMLREFFKGNASIRQELSKIDPLDTFFMEGVAMGAALSSLANYNTIMPYSISLFHWQKGRTLVIPKGTPYERDRGITRTAKVPVDAGRNLLYLISELDKDLHPPDQWTMRSHLVTVPQEGEIEVTLYWGEAGTEQANSRIQGAGLPGKIEFPEVKEHTTLGDSLERSFKAFLLGAQNLRQRIKNTEGPLKSLIANMVIKQVGHLNPQQMDALTEKTSREMLKISESDLCSCEAVVPENYHLTEEDVEYALQNGYFEARDNHWAPQRGIPKSVEKVLNLTFVHEEKISVPINALIDVSERLINLCRESSATSSSYGQLERYLQLTKQNRTSNNFCALAMALSGCAEYLHNLGTIGDDLYRIAKGIACAFDPRDF